MGAAFLGDATFLGAGADFLGVAAFLGAAAGLGETGFLGKRIYFLGEIENKKVGL